MSRTEALNVLTDEQLRLRKLGRYDEINLSDHQKEVLGEEMACWIESPTFWGQSKWCN